MRSHNVLFFCFFSALYDGSSGLIQAMNITKTEGDDFRDSFRVDRAASSRLFLCKNGCSKEDILIETLGNRARSGRYTIRYDGELFLTITELKQSDAGRYRFGVSSSSLLGSYKEFELSIRELCDGGVVFSEPRVYSVPDGGNVTIRCSMRASEINKKFLCREECKTILFETTEAKAKSDRYSIEYGSKIFFNVTITQVTRSDSGRYRCGVGRLTDQNTCQEFEVSVTNGYTLPLVVALIIIGLLAAFLLLIYKWKSKTNCLNRRGTSTGRSTELAPASMSEDRTYETVNPSFYEILNQGNVDHDQTYSTLGQQI